MEIESYRLLFKQELEKLKNEIQLYNDEQNIWIRDKQISNSSGNLCLHLLGNLKHFIGHVLGKTGYIRQRELEFILEDISKKDLINDILKTMEIVDSTLEKLTTKELQNDYPIAKFDKNQSIEFLLIHSLIHFDYHLGQINYHRRLLDC